MPRRAPAPRSRHQPRPRWRRRPDARPDEILNAALDVFAAKGFARTKLEDVARKAGVSKGTLYLYFDSKDALFRAVVRATKGPALAEGEAWLDGHTGTAEEALSHLIHTMWRKMSDPRQAAVSRLVQGEIKNFPELARFYFEEVTLRARRLIERVLARGVDQGAIRPDQVRFAARAIPSLALSLCAIHCNFAQYDPDPLSLETMPDQAVDFMLNGLRVRSPKGDH